VEESRAENKAQGLGLGHRVVDSKKMTQNASRPASPTQDLWSSILDSVSNSRSIPSKQILLLGEPQTGKSTITAALLQKQLEKDQIHDDFALGYGWTDIRDEADEGMCSSSFGLIGRSFRTRKHRYVGTVIRIHCTILQSGPPRTSAASTSGKSLAAQHPCYDITRLDEAMDVYRAVGKLAGMGRQVDQRRWQS
jgi:hypothetical protein